MVKQFPVTMSESEWKAKLGDGGKFQCLRKGGTERPNSHEYNLALPEKGIYKCAGCGHPLYAAKDKFKSSCGWPCYDQVIFSSEGGCHVGTEKVGFNTYEIHCNQCGGHLGHVFYGEGCTKANERH
eukprot:gnl/MRDRNA2_/MRDRNA2_111059_c0_seq1.p1 gnl/MRDRNA2_/MRDRNA2_111059_c0~~gnl/MRDRNA2_/MRDRNA2_111059_c0_seq1.p1  ORF type:complete len:126 (-),score=15.16 gnl/MRDRNA2_/MRDRNA2_111059_c0_seq1:82-459(-)